MSDSDDTAAPEDAGAPPAPRYVITTPPAEEPSTPRRARAKGRAKPEALPADHYLVSADEPEPEQPVVAEEPVAEPTVVIEQPSPQIVYVERPPAPKRLSNRPLGVLVVLIATVLFAVLEAFAVLIVMRVTTDIAVMSDLANPGYWLPVLLFAVSFLVAVLVANRAGWWAHIFASVAVGIVVYVGTGLLVAIIEVYALGNPTTFGEALGSPVTIVAGLLAREIALWAGALLGARGRRLTARNAAARAEYERSLAEVRAP